MMKFEYLEAINSMQSTWFRIQEPLLQDKSMLCQLMTIVLLNTSLMMYVDLFSYVT